MRIISWLLLTTMLSMVAGPASAVVDSGSAVGTVETFSQSLDAAQQPGAGAQWLQTMQGLISAQETLPPGRQFTVSPGDSLQTAVSQLQAGDTLVLTPGVYTAGAKFSASGTADKWITVVAMDGAVFDGLSKVGARLASDPIQGVAGLEHIVAALGDKAAYHNVYAFDTAGKDYIRFENLTVNRMMGLHVNTGSSFIDIDGLKTDGSRFAVRITDATDVSIRNADALNSWNGFRAEGNSLRLSFENIRAKGSKDVWDTMKPTYLNGDGFIFELTVRDVIMRNIVSEDHWDAGMDVKASNVLVENATMSGNKNNFKIWGKNVTIRDSLSHGAKAQPRPDGTTVEGNGLTVEIGGQVALERVTLADNQRYGIEMYQDSTLTVKDAIVAYRGPAKGLLKRNTGTSMASTGTVWNVKDVSEPTMQLSASDRWQDPGFADWTAGDYRIAGAVPPPPVEPPPQLPLPVPPPEPPPVAEPPAPVEPPPVVEPPANEPPVVKVKVKDQNKKANVKDQNKKKRSK